MVLLKLLWRDDRKARVWRVVRTHSTGVVLVHDGREGSRSQRRSDCDEIIRIRGGSRRHKLDCLIRGPRLVGDV